MKVEYDIDEEKLPNYKIFWVDNKQLKHVVLRFKAENDEEALAKLNEYIASDSSQRKHYYGRMHYVRHISSSGKTTVRALDDDFSSGNEDKVNFFAKIFSSISDFFSYWICTKPIDWWYKLKDIAYLLKHNEARSNQWNLDAHLIDTIILNVPSLIENSHGLMFLDEAILKLHGNEVGFDLKKYHEYNCHGYPVDVENLALKIQNEEYNKLLLNARLYKYYVDAGIVDSSNPVEVEFDMQWRSTLPVKPGTYDEFDYNKLKEMYQKSWNDIWDWIKKYGHTLYD